MANPKYQKFDDYCKQYQRLCKEAKVTPKKCESLTDRGLLMQINSLLIRLNCIPMDETEMDKELH